MSHGMSKAVNTKLTPKVSSNCMMLTISICFQVRLCSPATAFATKRNRWHRVSSMGKPQRGKSAFRVKRRDTGGRVSLPAHRFQALYVRIVEQHGVRSTEQRYKKKSKYKRRTPDCVFLCRESAATAPPYNEMGSSSRFVYKVTKSRNKNKIQSQNLFISSKFIRTIRQHFSPTRAKNSSTISQKQRRSQQNPTALFTDSPSDLTSYSSPPSSAPLRAPTRTQRIFVFCLHPSPPSISPSFLAS